MTDPTPEQIEAAFREGFALGDFAGGGQADPRTVDLAWQNSRARTALQTLDTQGELSQGDGLAEIAEYLIDQRDEPWPEGSESDRLHYWRSKAIKAARRLSAFSSTNQREEERGWQPIETAPKDGSYIIALYRSLDGYASHMDGRAFVVRHEGELDSGYDLGWALFPGFGGVPDKCLSGWQPLPSPPVGDEAP